jgi:uncharacterized membrane protein YbhN (UPF0104 family)
LTDAVLPLANISSFFDAVGKFFSNLAGLNWLSLFLALLFFALYITARTRSWFNAMRAAYPDEHFQWRRLWGAYWATYGVNNVVPVRGGEVIKLFLTKTSVPNSSYPAIAASFLVEHVFDASLAVFTLTFAFTQGVFPKPPDFSKLGAFDLSFLFGHPRFALFLVTFLVILTLVGFAVLSARVRAFWARIRQGWTILFDRRRYFRQCWLIQLGGTVFRFAAFWNFLEAFHIGGSFRNVVLVIAINTIATALPLTPGGAGVQQALLIKVFAKDAPAATVAAYSVGQQIAIAALSVGLGFVAIVFIFKFRSFREVIAAGREAHEADKAEQRRARRRVVTEDPAEPRARA